MSELMFGLESARAYLDYILVASKDSSENHLTHLEEVLARLANARLNQCHKKSFLL
jgi:hypothetical protein